MRFCYRLLWVKTAEVFANNFIHPICEQKKLFAIELLYIHSPYKLWAAFTYIHLHVGIAKLLFNSCTQVVELNIYAEPKECIYGRYTLYCAKTTLTIKLKTKAPLNKRYSQSAVARRIFPPARAQSVMQTDSRRAPATLELHIYTSVLCSACVQKAEFFRWKKMCSRIASSCIKNVVRFARSKEQKSIIFLFGIFQRRRAREREYGTRVIRKSKRKFLAFNERIHTARALELCKLELKNKAPRGVGGSKREAGVKKSSLQSQPPAAARSIG